MLDEMLPKEALFFALSGFSRGPVMVEFVGTCPLGTKCSTFRSATGYVIHWQPRSVTDKLTPLTPAAHRLKTALDKNYKSFDECP